MVRSRAVAIIAAVTLLACAASARPVARSSVDAAPMGGLCAYVDVESFRGFGAVAEQRHGDGHARWPAAEPPDSEFASAQFCLLRVGRGVVVLDVLRYADAAAVPPGVSYAASVSPASRSPSATTAARGSKRPRW